MRLKINQCKENKCVKNKDLTPGWRLWAHSIQSVPTKRLWKTGSNTCINRSPAGLIVQSGSKWIIWMTGVLGMLLHLPSLHSPLAATSSALRPLLCTNEREPCKGNSTGSSVYPLCHSSEVAQREEAGQMKEPILTWHTESQRWAGLFLLENRIKQLYFYLSTEHSKREGSPDVMLSLR